MIPHTLRHPVLALALGGICTAVVHIFASSSQAPMLAHDLAAATGFPVDTTTDIPAPWGLGLLGMAAAWTIWLCLETRSFATQAALLIAALGLCLTGSWLARLGGGVFPAVPAMAALLLAFVVGQFAVGLGGGPRADALRGLLGDALTPAAIHRVVSAPEPAAKEEKACAILLVECPEEDSAWMGSLRDGLLKEGAWVRDKGDGRLLVIHGLWEDSVDTATAMASFARAVESLVTRGPGWKAASVVGTVTRLLHLDAPASLHVRGAALTRAASWLDADCTEPDGLPVWLADPKECGPVPGWSPGDGKGDATDGKGESMPVRLRPA